MTPKREAVRQSLREPYRTLLGHFRHEVGHYYWDRLVAGTPWLEGFHALFGDESVDYAASLQRNYAQGPPADWPQHFVSAYASTIRGKTGPSAGRWAHYLHMRDAIDTALSFGLSVDRFDLEFMPFTQEALFPPGHPDAEEFLALLNHWTRLTTLLNEMSRSMGQPDFYPFVLQPDMVRKLHFIHRVVTSAGWPQDAGQLPPCRRRPSRKPHSRCSRGLRCRLFQRVHAHAALRRKGLQDGFNLRVLQRRGQLHDLVVAALVAVADLHAGGAVASGQQFLKQWPQVAHERIALCLRAVRLRKVLDFKREVGFHRHFYTPISLRANAAPNCEGWLTS